VIIFWAFISVFCGIAIIEAVDQHVSSLNGVGSPIIIASFGAAAVLEFYAIEAPLAQPRNAFFGQVISSIVGVAVCKLFQLSPHFESIRWLGGALSCASATALMVLTKTVHPPAGATALLAVVQDDAVQLGWMLIPDMILGSVLMLSTALLLNNIPRQFPMYWWTPESLSPEAHSDQVDGEPQSNRKERDEESNGASTISEQGEPEVVIRRGQVVVPQHIFLSQEERLLLEEISDRM